MEREILELLDEHCNKFNYELSSEQKDELLELYIMNNEDFDEVSFILHIENYVRRNGEITNTQHNEWENERRRSVFARRVSTNNFDVPMYKKTDTEFEFLYGSLGTEIPFSFLSQGQKEKLVSSMYPVIVKPDTVLIAQGDLGSEMYVVEYGEFDVKINGKFVNKLFRGAKFGELALLHEIPRTATVISVTESKVWAAEQTSFSSIRISDNLYKKGLVVEAMTDYFKQLGFDDEICKNMAYSASECVSIKIILATNNVDLNDDEVLVVFKCSKILVNNIEKTTVVKEVLKGKFIALSDIECGIINLKNIKESK